jgi:hypothetical protein
VTGLARIAQPVGSGCGSPALPPGTGNDVLHRGHRHDHIAVGGSLTTVSTWSELPHVGQARVIRRYT